jgi:hemolysin activation/secretion protein
MFGRQHETLDVQFRLGLSSDPLFGTPSYSLGGSSTLRGYPASSFTGNAYVLANLEYFAPFGRYYPLRGGVFVDIGNAYPSNSDLDFSDLKTGMGVGLRLKLKSFVKIDLRVDYAYAPDTGDKKVYAGTKEVF